MIEIQSSPTSTFGVVQLHLDAQACGVGSLLRLKNANAKQKSTRPKIRFFYYQPKAKLLPIQFPEGSHKKNASQSESVAAI